MRSAILNFVATAATRGKGCLATVPGERTQRNDRIVVVGPEYDTPVASLGNIPNSHAKLDRLLINDPIIANAQPEYPPIIQRADQEIPLPDREKISFHTNQVRNTERRHPGKERCFETLMIPLLGIQGPGEGAIIGTIGDDGPAVIETLFE